MRRTALIVATAGLVLAGMAIPAAADVAPNPCPEGSRQTCRINDPQGLVKPCPLDQEVGPNLLCVYVGPGPDDKDLHAAVRLNPLLCAHLIVGNEDRRNDLVRTGKCTGEEKIPVPVTPAPAADQPREIGEAPPAQIVPAHLPVTG